MRRPRRVRMVVAGAGLAVAAMVGGCAGATPPLATGPSIPAAGSPLVYTALGASETAGVGLNDFALRERYAWPQLFFATALPRAATYYNLAVPGITTAEALQAELPAALALHPTVATVFFNVDDLIRGVLPATFGDNLDAIVRALRQGGRARVLVANAPLLDNLPAFQACQGAVIDGVTCPVPAGTVIPPTAEIDAAVSAYDAAVSAVAAREGATLVDLRAHSDQLTAHPEDLAADGLHPSALGNQVLATLFTAAYRR